MGEKKQQQKTREFYVTGDEKCISGNNSMPAITGKHS